MGWKLKTFDELTTEELYIILKERVDIFVVEQNCAYPEIDGCDRDCYHLFLEEEGELLAYLRIVPAGIKYEEASLGRVIVKQKHRGRGYAKELIGRALRFAHEELGARSVKIQAQHYLRDFYGAFGFQPLTEVYLEDGIPHLDMLLEYDQR